MALQRIAAQLSETVGALGAMRRAGLVSFGKLGHAAVTAKAARAYGPLAGPIHAHAINGIDRVALIDDLGSLTYPELDQQSNALARAWQEAGFDDTSVIASICRNSRWFVLVGLASAKLGARLVLMNTGFAAPQLAAVAEREGVGVFVYDAEFAALAAALPATTTKYVAWVEDPTDDPSLEHLIAGQPTNPLPPPAKAGVATQLTSGTTGTPKGVPRAVVSPLASAQILDRIPLRTEQTMFAAAPVFHATGLGLMVMGFALRNTIVLTRRFEARDALRIIAENRCDTVIVIPTMLQRIVDLGPDVIAEYDTSALKVVFAAGSSISPDLSRKTSEYLGEVLYNLYGSTECAVVTVATPADLKRSPGTAGLAPVTCRVALYDDAGTKITERGTVGRIFAANGASFAGYTDGRDKERIDGLLSTGDLGHFDDNGMLFIEGRDDDMIVSGGENVYPIEIENLLADRTDVLDVCVIGVPDPEFGQRLRAFVVVAPGFEPDPQGLKDHVKAHLARYKVPRDVVFLDELPRNTTGKLLRRVLVEMNENP